MKKYNIGLDIGTSSVGWAVVEDGTQKIMRKGNKPLWGVRLFEEADTAQKRRIARGNRRRFDRRRERIHLLQEAFSNEINKVDTNFFKKMKETFYSAKDNMHKTVPISKKEQEQINNYYKKYPTIYHLRKRLINDPSKEDIRLVYLAIHHIIKYRGNFLYNTTNFSTQNLNIKEKIREIIELLPSIETLEVNEDILSLIDYTKIEEALLEPSKNDKRVYLKEALGNTLPNYFTTEFIKLLVGDQANLTKMLNIDAEAVKISFKGMDYEDKYQKIEDNLGSQLEFVESLKELYNMVFLKTLFKDTNTTSLSNLMVKRYHQHEEDLETLKTLFRHHRPSYNQLFRNRKKNDKDEFALYEKYIRNQLSFQEFSKELNKLSETLINYVDNQATFNKIKEKIMKDDFLPRIADTDNGKYPYQLNKDELIKIIENQGKYYPFLLEKTKDGTYKIVKLLEFRIPYYVGPLNDTTSFSNIKNKNAWAIRKQENITITPYNFHEVIDVDASAEEFIMRMIGNCTYLLNEKVMATNSILYSKFKVLNELKQIRINGNKIDIKSQKNIFNNLFLKEDGTITEKKFKNYLRQDRDFDMYDEFNITGYSADNKFANNMQSYVDFFGENGIFKNTNYTLKDAEEIINWITIFEDKTILKKKVKEKYEKLEETAINKIMSKRYTGWSNLSKKLLTTPYYLDPRTHDEYKSIMDLIEETDQNFMQILYEPKYHFQDMIREYNQTDEDSILNYNLVDELATSPANKRGIYQSLKVLKELIDYIGYEPEQIVLEMARGDEKKVRKDDRKKNVRKII